MIADLTASQLEKRESLLTSDAVSILGINHHKHAGPVFGRCDRAQVRDRRNDRNARATIHLIIPTKIENQCAGRRQQKREQNHSRIYNIAELASDF